MAIMNQYFSFDERNFFSVKALQYFSYLVQ